MAVIEAKGLHVAFGNVVAVEDVSITVGAGEVVTLIGPNGAGKTTTVETLEGYRSPDSGSVRVLGLDPVADRAALAPRIGVMLQEGGTYPGLSARRALTLFASYYDNARPVDEMLDLTGLTAVASTPAKRLSGGERRRLALALALVGRPEVAFLDEPTAGVDPEGRVVVRSIVRSLASQGAAVLLTTHELAEAERVASRVVIVDHGRVVAEGKPAELVTTAQEILFAAPTGIDVASLAAALMAPVTEVTPGEYRVATAASPQAIAGLTAWLAEHNLPLADLRAGRQSLEDAYMRITASIDKDDAQASGRTR